MGRSDAIAGLWEFKERVVKYWHMQMHPDDKSFADEHVYAVLEHKKIIGLGDWRDGQAVIARFKEELSVNDIVAIKNGAQLIALVQVVGGAYEVGDDESEIGWIEHRRPIRVLDWELEDKRLPQPRGTLERCVNDDAETTKVIREWHSRVLRSLEKRRLAALV